MIFFRISSVPPAIRDAGYEVGITAEDAAMLPSYDYILEDESVVEVGRLRIHTHHTPGHTPGSMSFSVEGAPLLFSGDTLFPGGPGATQFEGGDFPTIMRSIEDRMFRRFDADTIVLCTGQEPERALADALAARGVPATTIGGAEEAAELDALRAIDEGVRLAQAM